MAAGKEVVLMLMVAGVHFRYSVVFPFIAERCSQLNAVVSAALTYHFPSFKKPALATPVVEGSIMLILCPCPIKISEGFNPVPPLKLKFTVYMGIVSAKVETLVTKVGLFALVRVKMKYSVPEVRLENTTLVCHSPGGVFVRLIAYSICNPFGETNGCMAMLLWVT